MGTIYLEGICYSSGGGGGGASSADQVSLDDTNLAYEADDVQEAFEKVTKSLTYAEYEALTDAEKNNGTIYLITDVNGTGDKFQPVIYSEEEREIGVWTDGKPLYEKTINLSGTFTLNNNEWTNLVNLTDYSVDSVISCDMLFSSGNEQGVNDGRVRFSYSSTTKYLRGAASTNTTIGNPTLTIRYTKTTDTAGSGTWTPQGVPAVHYSTDEQIVGTWIDGNTLYQKTLVFQAPSTRDYTQQPLGVSVDYATVVDSAVIKNGQIGIFNGDYDGSPANDEWQGFINKSNSSFDYRVGANYLNADCYITLRYTKSST